MESLDTNIPGYGFDPTHEQLLAHYLKQRILDHFNGASQATHAHLIPDIDLYEYDPKELPSLFRDNSHVVPNRNHCFFFCRPSKKYRNSRRSDRTVRNIGYWKATCKNRALSDEESGANLGSKKTLVFHAGRAPKGVRTGWIMHEYNLNPTYIGYNSTKEMPFVLCRIKKKDDDNENDDEPSFDQESSSNHGGYQTQPQPIQQEPSGDEDQQIIWGSLSTIQNLDSDFHGINYDNSYQPSSYVARGYYNNNQVYDGNGAVATTTWMPPSSYHNYQDYLNSCNPYI